MNRTFRTGRLLVPTLFLLAACSDQGSPTDEVVEEPAGDVYESVSDSVQRPLEEAAEVEALLEDRMEAAEDALNDATGN